MPSAWSSALTDCLTCRYAIGCYYFLQVLVEGFALGTIATAVFRFNANPAAYLAAVEELAGPKTALSVVNKVQVLTW